MNILIASVVFILVFQEPVQRADNITPYNAVKEGSYYNIYRDGIKLKRTIPKWSGDDGRVLTIVDIVGKQTVEFTTVDSVGRESIKSKTITLDADAANAPANVCQKVIK